MIKKIFSFFSAIIFSLSVFSQVPNWPWAKRGGGYYWDYGNSVATDANGNVYITGYFSSSMAFFGNDTLINSGSVNTGDIFVVKYNNAGNVLWAQSAGGNDMDESINICADANGNCYMTGCFASSAITFGSYTLINSNPAMSNDFFVVKYDASGNVLWAKQSGVSSNAKGLGISNDASGNVYVTGFFSSSTITFETITLINAGANDIFIVKYDGAGNVQWAKSVGGFQLDWGDGISTHAGSIYLTGQFDSDIIIFDSDTLTNTFTGQYDIFVAKYDTAGNVLWAKSAGGTDDDIGYGISTDSYGNAYVGGYFYSTSMILGNDTLNNTGAGDIFVTKLDGSGNILWAKNASGTGDDRCYAISADVNGNVYITGYFQSSAITFDTTTLTNTGSTDVFITKYDGAGSMLWAEKAVGANSDIGWGISAGVSNVYITGYFQSTAITFGSTTLNNIGTINSTDVFLAAIQDIPTDLYDGNFISARTVFIYPNPATSELKIENAEFKIESAEFYNTFGQHVFSQKLTANDQKQIVIDISKFSPGIYFVKLLTDSGITTAKFVKQ